MTAGDMGMLEKEYGYYLEHMGDFLPEHMGQFVVIKGEEVLGFYDTLPNAIEQTAKTHALGTFLVHQVKEEEEVQRFHSRVRF